jgi:hypothetical protein
MEERSGPRLVTQRHLEVAPGAAESPPDPEPPSPSPPPSPGTSAPVGPSNRLLLERQLRWLRERAKFESRRPDDEGSK